MSSAQLQNYVMLRKLKRQLSRFGLNPHDWKIDRSHLTKAGSFTVQHRLDNDFVMAGVFEPKEKIQVMTLKVTSL